MLRKMCKMCCPRGSVNYRDRKLTGEVTHVLKTRTRNACGQKKILKTITCTECGHEWQFSRHTY